MQTLAKTLHSWRGEIAAMWRFTKTSQETVVFDDGELGLSFGSIPLVTAIRIIGGTLCVVDSGLKATVVKLFGDFER